MPVPEEQQPPVADSPIGEAAPPSPTDDISAAFGRYEKEAAVVATDAPASGPPAAPEKKLEPPVDWQKQAREATERAERTERALRELEAQRAAEKVAAKLPDAAASPEPPKQAANEDPRWAQVREHFWTDNDKAMEIQRQIIADEQRRIVREEFDAREAARQSEERGRTAVAAAVTARDQIAERLKVPASVAEVMIVRANRHISEYAERTGEIGVWLMPENYMSACRHEFPELTALAESAAPPAVPPPAALRAEPPGRKDGAPPAPRREARQPLSEEMDRALSSLASLVELNEKGTQNLKNKMATQH